MVPLQFIAHPSESDLPHRFAAIGVQNDESNELVGTIEYWIALYRQPGGLSRSPLLTGSSKWAIGLPSAFEQVPWHPRYCAKLIDRTKHQVLATRYC